MEGVSGMSDAVSALTSTVSVDALWGVFTQAVPYIGIVVVAGFGFFLIRRMIKGLSTGKAKI